MKVGWEVKTVRNLSVRKKHGGEVMLELDKGTKGILVEREGMSCLVFFGVVGGVQVWCCDTEIIATGNCESKLGTW